MRIFVINGSASSGKDQFVKFIKQNYKNKCFNWSTIDKIKRIARKHLGWDGDKTEKGRLLLSELKKIWSEFNNGPFTHMVSKIDRHYSKLIKKHKGEVIYFIHCREPEEIQKFVEKYGDKCRTILIKRKDIEIPDNNSDKNVNNYQYNYFIENDEDLTKLEMKAKNFLIELKGQIKKNVTFDV